MLYKVTEIFISHYTVLIPRLGTKEWIETTYIIIQKNIEPKFLVANKSQKGRECATILEYKRKWF